MAQAPRDGEMRAMVFEQVAAPLRLQRRPIPSPGPGQLLLRVAACGVCRTDLHLLDGEVEIPNPPRILGHQIVATVVAAGEGAGGEAAGPGRAVGARVGVPWLGWTCGECAYCRSGRENLCPHALFTGRDIDGGMAEYTVADARFCFPIPESYPDAQAAPLLCAGLIGYRALRMCGEAPRLGLYGFGAAAHILAQIARWQGRSVYAFTRAGDEAAQAFARELGASWAGGAQEPPPEQLDAAIVFAPAGELVPAALRALAPGGTVVCGGIHMSDIPSFPYSILWQERSVRSVANLTRRDGEELLALAPRVPVATHVRSYPLEDAGRALEDLRAGAFTGAAVIDTA
ncbi:MAG TPA: zinc-dependent alcohol dehydrogenase family protein [Solirubrobacteraceae bacterium]|nr:zinc-dependent alcohol dehydrogenase family protein [Solirubrobacteraceae bacterium]